MLIDMHAHSSGISKCCRVSFQETIHHALDNDIDGIILTNHYHKTYLKDQCIDTFVERYINEFYDAENYGKQVGCKVFFGIEVTMEQHADAHMLIYGVTPDFIRRNPLLFDMTQQQLYDLVHKENSLLVHAHPLRNGCKLLDLKYMDGIEINCHPKYEGPLVRELEPVARENGLILTCGGDYHADTFRPKCGMIFPDTITSSQDICRWLQNPVEKLLYVQEPDTSTFQLCYTHKSK